MSLLVKAILVTIFTMLMAIDNAGFQMWRRPLPISLVLGIILGDIPQAVAIGATLELTWLGLANVGGSSPADMIMGSAVGVSLGVLSGGGIAAGVALAIPVSILAVSLGSITMPINSLILGWAEKRAETGDFDKVGRLHLLPMAITALRYGILTFLAVFFGSAPVEALINMIPADWVAAMGTASGALPAVGLAILLTMMTKNRKMLIFLLLGFVLVAYMKLPMLATALIGVVFAGLWDFIVERTEHSEASPATHSISEEVDL